MLLRTTLLSALALFTLNVYSQNFQGTIKNGATANSVKAVIRPATATSGQFSSVQLAFIVPTTVGTAPTAVISNNFITGMSYEQYNATEVTPDGSYYVYTFSGTGGTTVPTLSFTASTEYDLLEVKFSGNPNNAQVRLAQLPLGGIAGTFPGNSNFYLALNGKEVESQTNQFYGTGSFNSGTGYLGYGYTPLNNVALPLTWLNFSAQKQNGNGIVKWEVANQVNNDYFEVQVSDNGRTFTTIGKVPATEKNAYSFTDPNLSKMQGSYANYRIKQIDKDGNITYSDIKKLLLTGKDFAFSIIGNPIKGNTLNIGIQSPDYSNGVVAIYDLNGKQLYMKNITWSLGYSQHALNIPYLASGTYTANLISENGKFQVKFVK